ncbi:NAD(P)H-dependent oxidoreductase [Scytonema sp. NUACC21]
MNIAIVSGSHRVESQSGKVALFIQNMLAQPEFEGVETVLFDLGKKPLPEWEESKWQGAEKWKLEWEPISNKLKECDALVAVSPEWSGMVPPRLKNFFLLCDNNELAHKPGLIVAVSSSRGGAYPIAELRMSSYKNTRLLWIPEHVIVRDVEKVLNETFEAVSKDDKFIQDRLLYGLKLLVAYAKSLINVRESGIINHEEFPYGM